LKAKAEQLDHLRTSAAVVAALLSCEEADAEVVDASPFDAIYDTYAPLLRRIAVSRFGISTADAADLVHDVFATYLVNPKRVEELRPYLIGAICNASRSFLRKSSTRSAVCSAVDACDIADDNSMHERVVREVLIGRILGRLGRSCRETLHLFYIHGEPAAVIAERRNTTPGYIGRLLTFVENVRSRHITLWKRENGDPPYRRRALIVCDARGLSDTSDSTEAHFTDCADCRDALLVHLQFDSSLRESEPWRVADPAADTHRNSLR